MALTESQLENFYDASLAAGAILSGFIGTFLNFRIQREAMYYRQPVLEWNNDNPGGRAKDVFVDRSRFPLSLVVILLGALVSILYGVFLPLSALAHWNLCAVSPATILAGLVASIVLVATYFCVEMLHYKMFRVDRTSWANESWMAVIGISGAAALAILTYLSLRQN